MLELVLSVPAVQLYLLIVTVLTIAALWPRPPDPPAQDPDGRQGPPPPERDGDGRRPAGRFPKANRGGEPLPVRELKDACAAEYAARASKAIKTIKKF
jgi:hypothetical protein